MLPSAKKDSDPTTQKSCVVYEFLCRCKARYVGRTTQRLAERIKQHVPTSIRKKSNTVREQPPRLCKNNNSKINCESAIGPMAALQWALHLTKNICSVKSNAKSKKQRKTIIMPNYNDNSGYLRYTKKKEKPVLKNL